MMTRSFHERSSNLKISTFSEKCTESPEMDLSLTSESRSEAFLAISQQDLISSPLTRSSSGIQKEASTFLLKSLPLFTTSSSSTEPISKTQHHSPIFNTPKQCPKPALPPFGRFKMAKTPLRSKHVQLHREPEKSGVVSPTVYDSIRSSTQGLNSAQPDGHHSPPASKWLKRRLKSPKTLNISPELSSSDSDEEMMDDDVCVVPSEEDSSDEELRRISKSEEMHRVPCPKKEQHFTIPNLSKSENDVTEASLFKGSSK
ncbi:hypothetical protein DNTS_009892, partial [Danionella cerebrum]